MNLSEAALAIRAFARRMDTICRQTVFDEFGIVQFFDGTNYLCWYQGSRRQEYIRNFSADTALLRSESLSRLVNRYEIGDFEFVPDGSGTQAEGFLVVGDNLFLICTNTQRSMAEITSEPGWLDAQETFVELSERFRLDPLVLGAAADRAEIPE